MDVNLKIISKILYSINDKQNIVLQFYIKKLCILIVKLGISDLTFTSAVNDFLSQLKNMNLIIQELLNWIIYSETLLKIVKLNISIFSSKVVNMTKIRT